MELLGEPGTPAFDHWAHHPELRIMYVNSFRRLGVQFDDATDFFTVVPASVRVARSPTTRSPTRSSRRVLDAATYAPSAENRQPWEFVVVRDPVRRAAGSASSCARAWEEHGRAHSEGPPLPRAASPRSNGRDRRDQRRARAHRRRRGHEPRPARDRPVVDLPRAPEPAARGGRGRPRLGRSPRSRPRSPRSCATRSGCPRRRPGRGRPARRPGRAARPAEARAVLRSTTHRDR